MTVTCALCENEIRTGEPREIRRGETVHTYCGRKYDAVERYSFQIQNPESDPRVAFGFWYSDPENGREYPVLENTGGLTIFASSDSNLGDSLPVKPEFVTAFGLGWHWLMCYRPVGEDMIEKAFEDIERDYYSGKMGDHERWALFTLLTHALLSPVPLPFEYKPLVDFADQCTTMGTPEVADG